MREIGAVGQVACGSSHTVVVSQDGRTVWSFGGGDNGEGHGDAPTEGHTPGEGHAPAEGHTPGEGHGDALGEGRTPSKDNNTSCQVDEVYRTPEQILFYL